MKVILEDYSIAERTARPSSEAIAEFRPRRCHPDFSHPQNYRRISAPELLPGSLSVVWSRSSTHSWELRLKFFATAVVTVVVCSSARAGADGGPAKLIEWRVMGLQSGGSTQSGLETDGPRAIPGFDMTAHKGTQAMFQSAGSDVGHPGRLGYGLTQSYSKSINRFAEVDASVNGHRENGILDACVNFVRGLIDPVLDWVSGHIAVALIVIKVIFLASLMRN